MALFFDLGVTAVDLKIGTLTIQWGRWITDLFGLVDSLNTSVSAIPGVNNKTIAQLNALGLGAGNANYLARVTDGFNHLVRWDGAAWQWGPGDSGAGYFGSFAITPDTGLWAACDGSGTTYLSGIGTVTLAASALTTPNVGTGAYLNSGAYTGTVNAAVAAGMSTVGVLGAIGDDMDIFFRGINAAAFGVDANVADSSSKFTHKHFNDTAGVPKNLVAALYVRR